MNSITCPLWIQPKIVLATSLCFVAVACTIYPLASDLDSTPVVSSGQEAYPGPVPTSEMPRPLPTIIDGSQNIILSYFATPAPNEKVAAVNVAESVFPPTTQNYVIEGETSDSTPKQTILYVIKKSNNEKIRLGDDAGSAILAATSDNYVAWFFTCEPCPNTANGLHIYSINNDKNILIVKDYYSVVGSIIITDEWITYFYPNPNDQSSKLFAYHIATGETIVIADDAYYSRSDASSYIALNEEMMAWVSKQSNGDLSINVFDLAQKTKRQIKAKINYLKNLNVSNGLVVWWDIFWKGHDLESDEVFTLPIVPPGWDASMISGVSLIKANGKQLSWVLENDGKTHYFTASIVPKENLPPNLTPNPPTPIITSQPTSYP